MSRNVGLLFFFVFLAISSLAQNIELDHWKLELPSGYTLAYPEILNFEEDEKVNPFLRMSTEGGLLFVTEPTKGSSTAKYSKNFLREQIEPKNDSKNWSFKTGGKLKVELEVVEMSKDSQDKYHRTVLFQLVGKTSPQQMQDWNINKAESIPLVKVYWQNERLRVQRKTLKYKSMEGEDLLKKDSWISGPGNYFSEKISFEKVTVEMRVLEEKIVLILNDDEEITFADSNIRKWPFEVFFNVGNYLQTNDEGARSQVKYHKIEVSHAEAHGK